MYLVLCVVLSHSCLSLRDCKRNSKSFSDEWDVKYMCACNETIRIIIRLTLDACFNAKLSSSASKATFLSSNVNDYNSVSIENHTSDSWRVFQCTCKSSQLNKQSKKYQLYLYKMYMILNSIVISNKGEHFTDLILKNPSFLFSSKLPETLA